MRAEFAPFLSFLINRSQDLSRQQRFVLARTTRLLQVRTGVPRG